MASRKYLPLKALMPPTIAPMSELTTTNNQTHSCLKNNWLMRFAKMKLFWKLIIEIMIAHKKNTAKNPTKNAANGFRFAPKKPMAKVGTAKVYQGKKYWKAATNKAVKMIKRMFFIEMIFG